MKLTSPTGPVTEPWATPQGLANPEWTSQAFRSNLSEPANFEPYGALRNPTSTDGGLRSPRVPQSPYAPLQALGVPTDFYGALRRPIDPQEVHYGAR
eukprot:3185247-Pyramimonas_sp.AAC.1